MMIFFNYFSVIFIQSSSTEAVIPKYVNRVVCRKDAIEKYLTLGFTTSEILSFEIDR